jgi:thiol:disulfide interchange protein
MIRLFTSTIILVGLALLAMGQPPSHGAAAGQGERVQVQTALNQSALRPGDQALAAVVLDIAPGFHVQSHTPTPENIATVLQVQSAGPLVSGEPVYPPGIHKNYPALGELNVYSGRAIIYLPVSVPADAQPGPVTIAGEVSYQACDDRQCFLPENIPFSIQTSIVPAGQEVRPGHPELFADYDSHLRASASPQPAVAVLPILPDSRQVNWGIAWAFGVAFFAGLVFNVMPCVLPVLPLKAISFFEVAQHDRTRALVLGAVFSIGVVLFFALLAIPILALRLFSWGEPFSNPWVVWPIVGILALMAAGMFGLFNVKLPSGVYSFTPRHDTFGGNLAFGMFTALLATPCTAPLFPPLMLWAAAQPLGVGMPAMMMVGVGMAAPYFALSAFPELARRMPRTGPWSELVKQMMGFLLLIAAAYFAGGRLIAGADFWWLVLAVVAVSCIFLVGRTIQFSRSAAGLAVAAVLAVGLFSGTLYQTVKTTGILATGGSSRTWAPFSAEALEQARAENRVVLVKFTANWCATCQVVESRVFGDQRVWQALAEADVLTLKADLTSSNPPAKALLLSLNPTGGIPLTAVYSPKWPEPAVLESLYTSQTLLRTIELAR